MSSLQLCENAHPIFVKPREIPFALRDAVEAELRELQRDQIITPIEKCDWGTPLVPISKGNGKVRLAANHKITVNPQLSTLITLF